MEKAALAAPDWRARWLALAAVAAAVGAGMLGLALGGAPSSYLAINGAALGLLAALLLLPGQARSAVLIPAVTFTAIALPFAALLLGPDLQGVQRWIMLGPIWLHAGILAIPALVAVLPRQREGLAAGATALAMLAIWAQPDFASALALFGGIAFATAGLRLSGTQQTMRLAAAIGLIATAFRPDPLTGLRFVETALGDGWALSPFLGLVMAVTLIIAITAPPLLLTRGKPELQRSARAVSGAMAGFILAGLLAPFPQPLIGYGASPIIGYALALAVLRFTR